jgi:hypothetical protein
VVSVAQGWFPRWDGRHRCQLEREAPPLARVGPTAAQLLQPQRYQTLVLPGAQPLLPLTPQACRSPAPPQPSAPRPGYRGPVVKGSLVEEGRGDHRLVWSTRVSVGVCPTVGHGVRVKGGKEVRHVKPPSTPRAWPCKAGSHPHADCVGGFGRECTSHSLNVPTKGPT